MTGTIRVIDIMEQEVLMKSFINRITYMQLLANVMENYGQHLIQITFKSAI